MKAPAILHKGERPTSIDFGDHLNAVSRNRVPSPLKHMLNYMFEPGMISLAGGLPHPILFPFQDISVTHYAPDSRVAPGEHVTTTQHLSIPKIPTPGISSNLSKALQYTDSKGSPDLVKWLRDWTERIIKPGYEDFEVLPNIGSTDGWSKVVNLLCEPGDYILVEEHTYPSALTLWAPMNCKGAAIPLDCQGILPEALERILANWDVEHPDERRPRLMYTIPVGQNPTGATIPLARKKQIYELCVKYDIIICEDDPYYFTTLPNYVPCQERTTSAGDGKTDSEEEIISLLEPTFCHLDCQGRVIRLETFSKTIAPGLRLGYFICNPTFAERLVRATEVVTQAPNGLAQAIVLELLQSWGQSGFLSWLDNIRNSYAIRRDWLCDILSDHFDVITQPDGLRAIAYVKGHGSTSQPVFSFAYPAAGMFIWLKVDLPGNARYEETCQHDFDDPEREWTQRFWEALTDAKILVTPGFHYIPYEGVGVPPRRQPNVAYFRLSYSYETREEMVLGIARMTMVFEEWWGVESR